MVTYSLKKSYRLKDLREMDFKDLWGDHGIFTTMWIFGKPVKILFFDLSPYFSGSDNCILMHAYPKLLFNIG